MLRNTLTAMRLADVYRGNVFFFFSVTLGLNFTVTGGRPADDKSPVIYRYVSSVAVQKQLAYREIRGFRAFI